MNQNARQEHVYVVRRMPGPPSEITQTKDTYPTPEEIKITDATGKTNPDRRGEDRDSTDTPRRRTPELS